eukprot:m.106978 g.106978  ORF g.106978 m.106978 type:complete len:173 (+) comp37274_c0_seq5:927-1445(+)
MVTNGGFTGGYTTGCRELINLLRQKSRPYIFSSTLSTSVVAAASKAFDILQGDCMQVKILAENARRFRAGLEDAGFQLIQSDLPLIAVMVKEEGMAKRFEETLFDEGILVTAMYFPVVPKNKSRIRVVMSASHSLPDIETCIEKFVIAADHIGLERKKACQLSNGRNDHTKR